MPRVAIWPTRNCLQSRMLRSTTKTGAIPPQSGQVGPGVPTHWLGSEDRVGYLATSAKCQIFALLHSRSEWHLALWHSTLFVTWHFGTREASGTWHSGTRPCLALGTLALEK